MDPSTAPPEVILLAQERATARAQRDWPTADSLKARIESAGWRVVDSGTAFDLLPARPPDLVEDGQTVYGAVASVPSRSTRAGPRPGHVRHQPGVADDPAAALGSVALHRPAATQVLVVAPRDSVVEGTQLEIIRTVQPFSPGDALTAAIRRSIGSLIIVLAPDAELRGDIIAPLTDTLADGTVAVAGHEGVISTDMQHYHPAGFGEVTTLRSGCFAFRRADAIAREPIDGRLNLPASVAAWWGLQLRDEGPEQRPRRAISLDLPLERRDTVALDGGEHVRLARRDAYRIARRFRRCAWLASELPPERWLVGDGADGHDHHDDPDEGGDAAPA